MIHIAENDIKFIHLISDNITIAFTYIPGEDIVAYGVSYVNTSVDSYSRKIGRYISKNRLMSAIQDRDMCSSRRLCAGNMFTTTTHLNYLEIKARIMELLNIKSDRYARSA